MMCVLDCRNIRFINSFIVLSCIFQLLNQWNWWMWWWWWW